MSITISAQSFKQFIADSEWFGSEITVRDAKVRIRDQVWTGTQSLDDIPDEAPATIEEGYIEHEMVGPFLSLVNYYRRWQDFQQGEVRFIVACPPGKSSSIREVIEQMGGDVERVE